MGLFKTLAKGEKIMFNQPASNISELHLSNKTCSPTGKWQYQGADLMPARTSGTSPGCHSPAMFLYRCNCHSPTMPRPLGSVYFLFLLPPKTALSTPSLPPFRSLAQRPSHRKRTTHTNSPLCRDPYFFHGIYHLAYYVNLSNRLSPPTHQTLNSVGIN